MKVAARTKRALFLSFSLLYGAGALYWVSHRYLRRQGEFGDEPGWLERMSGPLHLLAAFVFLFVIGTIWTQHVQPALRRRKQRVSGWSFLGLLAFLTGSGVAIVYGAERIQRVNEQVHPLVGFSLLPLLFFHWKKRAPR